MTTPKKKRKAREWVIGYIIEFGGVYFGGHTQESFVVYRTKEKAEEYWNASSIRKVRIIEELADDGEATPDWLRDCQEDDMSDLHREMED